MLATLAATTGYRLEQLLSELTRDAQRERTGRRESRVGLTGMRVIDPTKLEQVRTALETSAEFRAHVASQKVYFRDKHGSLRRLRA